VALGWLGGFAVFALAMWRPRVTPFAASAATALLLLAAVVNLYPDKQAPGAWHWTPADVIAYEVRSGAVGTTSLGEFNPVWAEAPIGATSPFRDDYPPDHQPDRLPATLPAGVTAMQIAAATQRHEFQISTPTAISLTLDLLYFPGWQATGAGLSPQPVTGLALLHVPAGADQRVTLTYAGTPLERAAGWLSLLAWIGLFGLVGWRVLASRKGAKPQGFHVGGSTKTAARSAEPPLARSAELTSKPRPSPLLAASLLVAAVLVVRAAAPGWFRISSPPGVAAAASVAVDAEFGAAVRVIGVDPPPTQIQPGELLDATVYLEAAASLSQDYGLFLHLDRPDGVTVAAVDVLHPDEIPMRTWPAGFYVRAPLRLAVPPDALPIRYALHLGVPDPANGRWLPLENGETLLHLGDVWVEPATPAPAGAALATFGEQIELLAADVAEDGDLHLRWRVTAQVEDELTMFVHYLDAAGRLLGQADGAPYGNLYPPAAWRPHQVVEDVRALPAGVDPAQVAAVQVGLYAPLTGERLPARTEVHQLGPHRPQGKPALSRHDELRPVHQRSRQFRDHGSCAGDRRQLLRHRQPLRCCRSHVGYTEEIIGRWLAQGGRRDRIVLATKVYGAMGDGVNDRGLSAYHIRKACEDSLRRLQTDHIDLYQMHHVERTTPWEEIWQAMEQLVREGKVLYVGSSNFAGWHIATGAVRRGEAPLHGAGLRAEPLQPQRAHDRTGSHPRVPGVWAGADPVESAGGRAAGRRAASRRTEGRRASERIQQTIEKHRPQLEAYEALCAGAGRGAGRCGAGVDAAQPGRDRADHRAAHAGAVRRQRCARWRSP
jgi:hypothetical protein